MIDALQGNIYKTMMLPSTKVILQMELTGMPLNIDKVSETNIHMARVATYCVAKIQSSYIIVWFTKYLRRKAHIIDFITRRDKAKKPENIKEKELSSFSTLFFNPGSDTQLQELIYDKLGFPITSKTKGETPSTKSKILKKILNRLMNKYNITKEKLM